MAFLFIGTFTALINLLSRIFYNNYMSFPNAVIMAFLTGMIVGFILYKIFVFKKSIHSTFKEIYLYIMVNFVTIIQTYLISVGLEKYLFPYIEFEYYPKFIAHIFGVAIPALSSFIGHKYFTFKSK